MACSSSRNLGFRYIVISWQRAVGSWQLAVGSVSAAYCLLRTVHSLEFRINQKLGRYNHRHKETRYRVEQLNSRLPVHVRDVAEIPCHQQVGLGNRGQCYVQRIRQILAMKDTLLDIAVRQNRRFLGDLDHRQVAHEIQISSAPRLLGAFQLADHQRRDQRRIIRKLVLPPSNRQVAAKGLPVVQVRSDHGRFEIKALLHAKCNSTTRVGCKKAKEKWTKRNNSFCVSCTISGLRL